MINFWKIKFLQKNYLFFGIICIVFATVLSLVLFSFVFLKNTVQIEKTQIIKNFTVKQVSVNIAGQPVKWKAFIKRSSIASDKNFIQLPKTIQNVKTKIVSKEEFLKTISQSPSLDQISDSDRKKIADINSSSFIAQISNNFFASLNESVDNIIEEVTSSPNEEVVVTEEASFVNVSNFAEEPEYTQEEKQEELVEDSNEKKDKNNRNDNNKKNNKNDLESSDLSTLDFIEETQSELEKIKSEEIVEEIINEGELQSDSKDELQQLEENAKGEVIGEQEENTASVINNESVLIDEDFKLEQDKEFIEDKEEYVEVEYTTEGAKIREEETKTGKIVSISSPEEDVHEYVDVLAYTTVPELFKLEDKDKIKIKWKNNDNQEVEFKVYDLNGNGKIDYVEWVVPHLSEQTFEIIFISKAFRLDQTGEIIENIYDLVKEQDNNWVTIEENQYVRVTFEKVLNNTKDNTIYARLNDLNKPAFIEVYPVYTDQDGNVTRGLITAVFDNITTENIYKVLLSELDSPTDVFDLRVKGGNIDIDYIVDPSWWNASWNYRQKLIFNNSGQAENLVNFPVLVNLSAANFDFTHAKAAGADIRFIDADDSTLLDYEIEKWDDENSLASIWVEVPQIDSGSNTDFIYMYFGNESANDGQNITGTWNSNFTGVYHFAEQSGNYEDSSISNNDCSSVTVTSRAAAGKIGYAPDFEASNASNRIGCGTNNILGDVTQEAWINLESTGIRPIIQHGYNNELEAGNISYGLELDTSSNLWQQWEYGAGVNVTNTSTANVPTGSLTYVAAVRDNINNNVIWYINGVASGSPSSYTNDPTGGASGSLYIGGRITSAQWFDGIIDEIRISNSIRSANWIKASYLSETNSFITFDSEESGSSDAPTISSASNQVFAVNDPVTAISTITITDDDSSPTITANNDIRIKIPSTFNMVWDETDTTAVIGGGASSKVSSTVSYEDSNKTLVIDVLEDFSASDSITVSGLSFTNFSAASSADNLELEVENNNSSQAIDNKTIIIVVPVISSATNQIFEVNSSSTAISTITITDSTSPIIKAENDIRIKIPSSLNMTWDETDTTAKIVEASMLDDFTSSFYTNDLAQITIDCSGVTYNPLTDTLFFITNGTPTIYEFTTGGSYLRTITMTGFIDTEGITWISGNTYAVTQERDPYDIVLITIDEETTSINKSSGTVITPNITVTSNLGMEGITYDSDNNWFYVVVEKQADGSNGGRVFKVEMDATTTEFTTLNSNLLAAGYTDLADIAYDKVSGHLLILSQEGNEIIEATTDGTIINTRAVDTGIFSQPEGLALSTDSTKMFIAGELDDYQMLTRTAKVSSTVSYEDSNKTLVINVLEDFSASDSITVSGLSFTNFSAASSADNLELETSNANTTSAIDDKTITIIPSWWNNSWVYRKKISFNNSDQTEDLINFPVLVKLTSSNFDFSKALSAGKDLRFVDSDNLTNLSYEIEYYDSAGETAFIWVKVPKIDGSSDEDYIYVLRQ